MLGGGFIGAELASAGRERGLEVAVVEMQPVLLAGTLGEDVGSRVERLHREAGSTCTPASRSTTSSRTPTA